MMMGIHETGVYKFPRRINKLIFPIRKIKPGTDCGNFPAIDQYVRILQNSIA
jgi:hypothetical protein